ncbi:MAG: hypothetical protein HDR29_00450, partial [Lachnospiraceae bacterium]|nr:hypothetical protein [Lachnospiraceae bacterium]
MRKAKKLSNKLMAILLSASMVFAPVLQSMPVYAAEPVIEEGSDDTLSDSAVTDEAVTDNNDSDTPTTDNGDSGNQGTENGDTGKPGTENGDSDNSGTENDDSDNSGTENGDTGNMGNESGDSDNSGTENGDSATPGTEDGDTENPEEPDAEDGESGELGDAEADDSLNEYILPEEALESVGVMAAAARGQSSVNVSSFSNVGGWNESIYAEIAGVKPEDVVDVEYSGTAAGKLSAQKGNADGETALDYLVRKDGSGVRIDVPGLKAGTYTLTVTLGSNKVKVVQENIKVYAYDRSGYAHFKYTNGVGAYKDDGTLKSNAIVLYVNDSNKNTVKITAKDGTSVTGIGNILNSAGQKTNGNKGIIKKIAGEGRPIVVRFIGVVSDSGLNGEIGEFHAENAPIIKGLTVYNKTDDGGSVGDNGHMARIQSGKDITLEGIGYDATIDGWGFHFIAESSTTSKGYGKSFEVRNLKFVNTPEDAIGMEGQQSEATISASVERCWIHNNEFYRPNIPSPAEKDKAEGDGSVDFKRGMYFTCSYNYFDSCHKTNLVGSSDTSLQYNLSYHHNYWYMCKARGPLTRQANVHMYNNIFDMQTDYAMNTRANAYIFSESNLFYACKSPHAVEAGAIKSWNDSITSVLWNKGSKGTVVSSRDEVVPSDCAYNGTSYSSFENNSNLFYKDNYQLQDDDFVTMRKVIVSQTGIQKQHPKRPEEVTTSDYSVVARMSGGKTPKQIDVSNGTVTEKPGKISNTVYVFEVNANFDLEVKYSSGTGIVVDEEGKNRLEGDGKALNLPAGKYMIQALTFTTGDPAKNTIVTFKDFTIDSLKISQNDSGAHVHKWVLESTENATCTATGEKTYKCTGSGTCDAGNVKKESIPAFGHNYILVAGTETATCTDDGTVDYKCSRCLNIDKRPMSATGHKWGSWTVKTPATATTAGEEERVCANDPLHVETREIPPSGSVTPDPTPAPDPTPGPGGITVAGDYELNFKGKKPNGDTDFFTLTSVSYKNGKGPVIVNDVEYTDCLSIDSKAMLSFSCNDGASLILKLDVSGKKLEIDGKTYTSDGNGEIKVDLDAGTHTIAKGKTGDTDIFIFYVSVKNGELEGTYHNISFSYNYDNSPDDKVVSLQEGTVYTEEELLALASLNRNGCVLTGLYTDAFCKNAVVYPYKVSGSVILYAGWKDDASNGDNEVIEKKYSLIFDSNGGSTVATVIVSENQQYTIKQRPAKSGYVFAGWYDAKTGGNLVEVVDGAALKGNMTVYAHWNVLSDTFSLDCATDLNDFGTPIDADDPDKGRDITSKITHNGFTLHALPGGGGSNNESPKYYMTVHSAAKDMAPSETNPFLLYTNGVILDDKTIPGNEDGLLKTIEFTASGAGELTVKVASSGSLKDDQTGKVTGTCTIVLSKMVDGSLQEVFTRSLEDTIQREITIDIESAGTYYLYAAKQKEGAELPAKGVAFSSISFTQPKYTILYQTKGGTATGIVDVNEPKAVGDKIQLPTDCTLDGYTFEGWLIGDSTTAVGKDTAYTYTVSADDAIDGTITITAKYTPAQYTIKYMSAGGTMDSDSSDPVPAGKVIPLPKPTPPEGKEFVGWTIGKGDSKRTLYVSYTVRAEDAENNVITFTAEYKDKPVVYTIKFDGNGGNLPSDLLSDK